MKYLRKQNGISLVEFLIATAISLFLITSVFTVYLSNKKTYQHQQSLSYLQENTRLAFLSLTRDIHAAHTISYIPSENALQLVMYTPDSAINFSKNGFTLKNLQTIKYYVAIDKLNKKSISVLYRKDINNPNMPSALIDDVDNIQVFFYTKNNPTHEYKPSEISDYSKIIGVKILLALSSTDQHLHRELNIVIALRNVLT
jgi:type II secretory pathway component PulJ